MGTGTANGLAGLLAQTWGGSDREWGQARGGVGMALGGGKLGDSGA